MIDIDRNDILKLQRLVADADRVVLVCHVAPDGDALGSTLGMYHVLTAMGKRPAVITPDVPTKSLMFLPDASRIIAASRNSEKARVHIQAADLIVCLDFNVLSRIDKMHPLIESAAAPKILIDHHLNPDNFAEVTISRPKASSTCYLLYNVLKAAGWDEFVGKDAATCIYTGMMTDTGNFSFNSNDPGLYEVIAELIARGIDKDSIYKMACDTHSVDQLRLNSFAIYEKMKIIPEHKCAIISLTREELKRFNYVKGDTEGLVNVPLSVPEVVYSAFLREDEGMVKLSMRSKGDFPVNMICENHFGGGGHKNAAGGEIYTSLDEAIRSLEDVLPDYDKYL